MPPKNPRGFLTEEEKQSLPTVTWGLIRRILRYLAPYWARFLLVFATILLSAVLGLLPSIITGRIVDEALVGQNMTLLIQLLLMALVSLLENLALLGLDVPLLRTILDVAHGGYGEEGRG